jgi:6-phosphogluconate dehydrogenase
MMVPAAVVESTVNDLASRFEKGDIIVDGGTRITSMTSVAPRCSSRAGFTTSIRAPAAECGGSSAASAR